MNDDFCLIGAVTNCGKFQSKYLEKLFITLRNWQEKDKETKTKTNQGNAGRNT